jgi:hypothetical protein
MFLYTSQFTYQDGVPFPNTKSINSTGGATMDGTEFKKQYTDDIWGFFQALMKLAKLTPNDTAEEQGTTSAVLDSQLCLAIQRMAGHPGEIVPWMGMNKDPSSVDIRLLQCNGQTVDRTLVVDGEEVYGPLDAACWVGAGAPNATAEAFYRTSDAGGTTRSDSGNYLVLPDLRGQAIRGYDPGGTVDPDGGTREWGEIQGFAMEEHTHRGISQATGNGLASAGVQSGASFTMFYDDALTAPSASKVQTTDAESPAITSADETRMTNIAAVWCVRY